MNDDQLNIAFTNNLPPRQGSVLISDPFLIDDYFQRSVIFLCHLDEEGAFGFVLNNYVEAKDAYFSELFPKFKGKLSIGGPVEKDNLFYLHKLGNLIEDAIPLENGLYIGGDFNQLTQLINSSEEMASKVRFFVGYCGWSNEQLAEEFDQNTWKVIENYSVEDLFSDFNPDIWKEIMRKQGVNFSILSNSPIDPSNN